MMDKKVKDWIRKNWYRPVLHIIPMVNFLIVSFMLLQIWVIGLDNDAEMEWNLFITVAVFGALCWLTLLMIYFDKWTEYFYNLKKEYEENL